MREVEVPRHLEEALRSEFSRLTSGASVLDLTWALYALARMVAYCKSGVDSGPPVAVEYNYMAETLEVEGFSTFNTEGFPEIKGVLSITKDWISGDGVELDENYVAVYLRESYRGVSQGTVLALRRGFEEIRWRGLVFKWEEEDGTYYLENGDSEGCRFRDKKADRPGGAESQPPGGG